MPLSYAESLDFLFPRTTTIRFGLDTTRALLDELGRPHEVFASVHVGGTNGKGSTASLCAAALQAAGFRVGLYTSPHLVSFRERIRVDGVPIGEEAVAMWTSRLRPAIEAREATFFEATTAIAFADFAARGVEVAVVEVGMGGRLDSTNVLRPLVAGITKIDYDHMKYLGDTLPKIAREKAWIAKPGVPLVIGEERPRIVKVLEREARAAVAALDPTAEAVLRVVPAGRRWAGPLALAGPHQQRNAAVAAAILEALPDRWRPSPAVTAEAFARVRVPGRVDRRGRWLFDVAHNPDGIRALVATMAGLELPRPIHALVSILGDKAWTEMLPELDHAIDHGVLTVAPTAATRRWDMGWLDRWLQRPDRPPARATWTLEPDFGRALARVQEGAGTVLVTGSFHTVGDVMTALGMGPV